MMTKTLEQQAHEIETQYDLGQNIWRRPSVVILLQRIDELEKAISAAERHVWEQATKLQHIKTKRALLDVLEITHDYDERVLVGDVVRAMKAITVEDCRATQPEPSADDRPAT